MNVHPYIMHLLSSLGKICCGGVNIMP